MQTSVDRLLKSYPSARDRLSGHPCDLASANMEENVKNLFSKTGKLDHIVITAGDSLAMMPLQEATLENVQKAGMVRFFAPLMIAKHGSQVLAPGPASSITLTTGTISLKPRPNWSVIAGYAAGLHGMTRNLALDLAPIRVNLVSPGPVETELWNGMSKEEYAQLKEATISKALTGEFGQPSDVAEAYLYAIKDRNCSGSVIDTNSGHLLL